jgi:hypothetical protein
LGLAGRQSIWRHQLLLKASLLSPVIAEIDVVVAEPPAEPIDRSVEADSLLESVIDVPIGEFPSPTIENISPPTVPGRTGQAGGFSGRGSAA